MTLEECMAKYPMTSFTATFIFDRIDSRYWSSNDFVTVSEDYDIALIDENDEMWVGALDKYYIQGYFTTSGKEFFPVFLFDNFDYGEYEVYYDEKQLNLKQLAKETFHKRIKTFNIKEWYEEKVKNEI